MIIFKKSETNPSLHMMVTKVSFCTNYLIQNYKEKVLTKPIITKHIQNWDENNAHHIYRTQEKWSKLSSQDGNFWKCWATNSRDYRTCRKLRHDGSSGVNTEDDKPSNLSSEFLFKNILKDFPGHLDTEGKTNWMRYDEPEHVQDFLNQQFQNTDKCPKCNTYKLINYKYNKNNLKTNFISLDTIKKVIYHTKYCEICDLIVYPDLSEYNLNLH